MLAIGMDVPMSLPNRLCPHFGRMSKLPHIFVYFIIVVVVVVVIVVMVHQVRVCHNTTLVITMVIITIVRARPNKCVQNIHVFGRVVKSHD